MKSMIKCGYILAICLLMVGCRAEPPKPDAAAEFPPSVAMPKPVSEKDFEARQTPRAWPHRFTMGNLTGDYGKTTFEDVMKAEGGGAVTAIDQISWLRFIVVGPGGDETVTMVRYQNGPIHGVKISREGPLPDMPCPRIKATQVSAIDGRLRLGMTRAEVRKVMGQPIYDEPGYLMFAGKGPDPSRVDNAGDVTVNFVDDKASEIYAGRSIVVD